MGVAFSVLFTIYIFNNKKKVLQSSMPLFCLFQYAIVNYIFERYQIIYLSAIETLICRREKSLIRSTSFGFAQNTIHDFIRYMIFKMSY